MQELIEPALEGLGGGCGAAPFAKGEDAGGVVARAMQQLKEVARAALLTAAVWHGLLGHGGGAEQGEEEQQGGSLDLEGYEDESAIFSMSGRFEPPE